MNRQKRQEVRRSPLSYLAILAFLAVSFLLDRQVYERNGKRYSPKSWHESVSQDNERNDFWSSRVS